MAKYNMTPAIQHGAPRSIAGAILQFVVVVFAGLLSSNGDPTITAASYAVGAISTAAGLAPYKTVRCMSGAVTSWAVHGILIAVLHMYMYPGCSTATATYIWAAAAVSVVYVFVVASMVNFKRTWRGWADNTGIIERVCGISKDARTLARNHPAFFFVWCAAVALWIVLVDLAGEKRCDDKPWLERTAEAAKTWPFFKTNPHMFPAQLTSYQLGVITVFAAVVLLWSVVVRLWPAVELMWVRVEERAGLPPDK